MSNPTTPWAALVLHLHYPGKNHLQVINHDCSTPSHFWKGIMKTAPYVKLGLKYVLGNGHHLRFWLDAWATSRPLAIDHPTIANLADNQVASVASVWTSNRWLPGFRALLSQNMILELETILRSLSHLSPSTTNDDFSWTLHPSGLFSVNSLYQHISAPPSPSFPLHIIWKFKVPLKVRITVWLAAQNRLLTSEVLQRRNIAQPFNCAFCHQEQESATHLFIHCTVIRPILDHLRSAYRLPPIPPSIMILLTSWRRRWVSKRLAPTWDRLISAFIWLVWYQRNSIIFQNAHPDLSHFLVRVFSFASLWSA